MTTKRLRIFAGPNGSGKSTLIKIVIDSNIHLGVYVNADDLKTKINKDHLLDFSFFKISLDLPDLKQNFEASTWFDKAGGTDALNSLMSDNDILLFNKLMPVNDYFTAFLADYIRICLLEQCDKFTFETVMSNPSKLDFIRRAKKKGFRIYLYFVALESPELNINRVKARVQNGGHDVPDKKIEERYKRTMNLLLDAIRLSDRVYLFDNSYSEPNLFATVEKQILLVNEQITYIPAWFKKYIIDKL